MHDAKENDGSAHSGETQSDLDRRLIDEQLQQLVGTGQLSLQDYERRAGALWNASTRSELSDVTAGLPIAVSDPAGPRRSRPLPPSRSHSSLRLVAAAVAVISSGLVVGGIALSGASEPRRALLVEDGSTAVDVGRQAETVTVVVPDGVRVEVAGLDVDGDAYCDDACAWPSGPSVRLVGTVLEDVHVLSQTEWDSGQQVARVSVD